MAMSEQGSSEQRDALEARWSAWAGPAQSVLEVRGRSSMRSRLA